MSIFIFTREEVVAQDFKRFERIYGDMLVEVPFDLSEALFSLTIEYSGFSGALSADPAFNEFAKAIRQRLPYLCFLCDPETGSYFEILAASLPFVEVVAKTGSARARVGVNHADLAKALEEDVEVFRSTGKRARLKSDEIEEKAEIFVSYMFGPLKK